MHTVARKTQAERERELRLLFYTEDVDRVGKIDTNSFLNVFNKMDIIGAISKERLMFEINKVADENGMLSFPQFCVLLSKIERL